MKRLISKTRNFFNLPVLDGYVKKDGVRIKWQDYLRYKFTVLIVVLGGGGWLFFGLSVVFVGMKDAPPVMRTLDIFGFELAYDVNSPFIPKSIVAVFGVLIWLMVLFCFVYWLRNVRYPILLKNSLEFAPKKESVSELAEKNLEIADLKVEVNNLIRKNKALKRHYQQSTSEKEPENFIRADSKSVSLSV